MLGKLLSVDGRFISSGGHGYFKLQLSNSAFLNRLHIQNHGKGQGDYQTAQ